EAAYAKQARDWYEQTVAKDVELAIEFATEPSMSPVSPLCPWGLVFPPGQEDADNSNKIHDRFWANKHWVTTYEDIETRHLEEKVVIEWEKVAFYAFIKGEIDLTLKMEGQLGPRLKRTKRDLRRARKDDDMPDHPNTLYYVNRRDR